MSFMKKVFLLFILSGLFFIHACKKKDEVDPITITANDFTGSINENPVNGAVIGTISASVSQGALSYSLVSQNPAGAVSVSSNGELVVSNAAIFDFETNPQITGVAELANG